MNEFRKGLRKGFISLACALDAADEIERLEAERDALRAELAAERKRTERVEGILIEARLYLSGDAPRAANLANLLARIDALVIKGSE